MPLVIEGLTVRRGGGPVLRDLDFELGDGSTVALLGRNGAGKTTLLETIAGLLRPTAGSIVFDDRDLVGMPPHQIARRGVSLVPEGRKLFSNMTVMENLALGAHNVRWLLHGPPKSTYDMVWDLFPDLSRFRRSRAGSLSGGQQQMVTVARALMSEPRCLLLDEPTFGLSPNLTEAMCEQLRRLSQSGLSILLAEQNVDVAIDVAESVSVLSNGRIVASDSSDVILERPVFREAMFGAVEV